MGNIYTDAEVIKKYGLSRTVPKLIIDEYAGRIIQITSPERLIDVGCGTGSVLVPLSMQAPGRVGGLDISAEMCKVSKEKVSCQVMQGDAHDLQSIVGRVDAIHIKAVTHIPKYPRRFLEAAADALQPGGYIVLGAEDSIPERALEDLGNPGNSPVEAFYRRYFELRRSCGLPFQRPEMPAGDYSDAAEHLERIGFRRCGEFRTAAWEKRVSIAEVLEAMLIGTFTVFTMGVPDEKRIILADALAGWRNDASYSYPARLKGAVFRK